MRVFGGLCSFRSLQPLHSDTGSIFLVLGAVSVPLTDHALDMLRHPGVSARVAEQQHDGEHACFFVVVPTFIHCHIGHQCVDCSLTFSHTKNPTFQSFSYADATAAF